MTLLKLTILTTFTVLIKSSSVVNENTPKYSHFTCIEKEQEIENSDFYTYKAVNLTLQTIKSFKPTNNPVVNFELFQVITNGLQMNNENRETVVNEVVKYSSKMFTLEPIKPIKYKLANESNEYKNRKNRKYRKFMIRISNEMDRLTSLNDRIWPFMGRILHFLQDISKNLSNENYKYQQVFKDLKEMNIDNNIIIKILKNSIPELQDIVNNFDSYINEKIIEHEENLKLYICEYHKIIDYFLEKVRKQKNLFEEDKEKLCVYIETNYQKYDETNVLKNRYVNKTVIGTYNELIESIITRLIQIFSNETNENSNIEDNEYNNELYKGFLIAWIEYFKNLLKKNIGNYEVIIGSHYNDIIPQKITELQNYSKFEIYSFINNFWKTDGLEKIFTISYTYNDFDIKINENNEYYISPNGQKGRGLLGIYPYTVYKSSILIPNPVFDYGHFRNESVCYFRGYSYNKKDTVNRNSEFIPVTKNDKFEVINFIRKGQAYDISESYKHYIEYEKEFTKILQTKTNGLSNYILVSNYYKSMQDSFSKYTTIIAENFEKFEMNPKPTNNNKNELFKQIGSTYLGRYLHLDIELNSKCFFVYNSEMNKQNFISEEEETSKFTNFIRSNFKIKQKKTTYDNDSTETNALENINNQTINKIEETRESYKNIIREKLEILKNHLRTVYEVL